MTKHVLHVNGVQHPSETLTMEFSSTFGSTRAYEILFSSTGIHHDRAHMIKMEMFTKGFYVLGFDPTPDREADEQHISLRRQGNVRIEASFKKPLPESVTCILYAEFPGHIETDHSRNVTVEWIPFKFIVLSKHIKYFQGVYPLDLLPSTLTKSCIIIINLDKLYMPGSHWVAICFSDSGSAEYFDSYGLPPFRIEIMAYLQRHWISWTFNRHRLQGLSSNVCRHYCCFYALHRPKGLPTM